MNMSFQIPLFQNNFSHHQKMKKVIGVIILFAFFQGLSAQEASLDSLMNGLHLAHSMEHRAGFLYKVSEYYYTSDSLAQALVYVDSSLLLLQSSHPDDQYRAIQKLKGDILWDLENRDSAISLYLHILPGIVNSPQDSLLYDVYEKFSFYYNNRQQVEKAREYLQSYIELAERNQDPVEVANAYKALGSTYGKHDDFTTALELYSKGLSLCQNSPNSSPKIEGQILMDMAIIQYKMGMFEKSINYIQQGLPLLFVSEQYKRAQDANLILGNIFLHQDQNDSAKAYYEKALKLGERTRALSVELIIASNLGIIARHEKNLDQALFHYLQAEEILNRFDADLLYAQEWKVSIYINLGGLYTDKKNYKKAEAFYLRSLAQAENMDKVESLPGPHESLSDLYERMGKYEKAYFHYEKYKQFNDSIFSVEKKARFEELETKYQTERKEKEISQLNAEKRLEEAEIVRRSQQIYMLIAAFILLLSGAGFLVYFILLNQKREKIKTEQEKEIRRKKIEELVQNQALKSIDAMIEGQETERERIARDLHDRLGSTMAMIKLHFSEVADRLTKVQKINSFNYRDGQFFGR